MESKIEQKLFPNLHVCTTDRHKNIGGIVSIFTYDQEITIEPKSIPQLITILQEFIGNEGKCYECKRDVALMQDYNGHNYLVCTSCLDKLNKEFDEEYR